MELAVGLLVYIYMIRNCGFCNGILLSRFSICTRCREHILSSRRKPLLKYIFGRIPVYSMWVWRDGDDYLEELHNLLKKSEASDIASDLMKQYIEYLPRNVCFVSVPNSVFSKLMVEFLSNWTGAQRCSDLCWQYKLGPHKRLTKEDRLKSRMSFQSKLKPNLTYILVDDIVTTGATAKAAYEALSKPRDFRVWSLSCRL